STNGTSLRQWRSNSTNGSGVDLRPQASRKLPKAGTNSSTPSRFVGKASASKRYSRSTPPADREGTASTWTNGRSQSRLGVSCLSWKWRKRSSVKITERTYEERTEAFHPGRKSGHPEAASCGQSARLGAV